MHESRFDAWRLLGQLCILDDCNQSIFLRKKKKDFDYCCVLLGGILKHCIVPQLIFNKVSRLIVLKFLSSVECYHIHVSFWLVSLVWRS